VPGRSDKPNFQSLMEEFLILFRTFTRYNWMFLRCKGSSYPAAPEKLQKRVAAMYSGEPKVETLEVES